MAGTLRTRSPFPGFSMCTFLTYMSGSHTSICNKYLNSAKSSTYQELLILLILPATRAPYFSSDRLVLYTTGSNNRLETAAVSSSVHFTFTLLYFTVFKSMSIRHEGYLHEYVTKEIHVKMTIKENGSIALKWVLDLQTEDAKLDSENCIKCLQ